MDCAGTKRTYNLVSEVQGSLFLVEKTEKVASTLTFQLYKRRCIEKTEVSQMSVLPDKPNAEPSVNV